MYVQEQSFGTLLFVPRNILFTNLVYVLVCDGPCRRLEACQLFDFFEKTDELGRSR